MDKKTYIKPEMMVEVLETEVLMFSGSLNDNTEVDTDSDQLAIGRGSRRGKWGNLWYEEE